MTEPKQVLPPLPSPAHITTMSALWPAFMLERLYENAKHTISRSLNFVPEAFDFLKNAITPFLNGETLDEIFYLPPQAPLPQMPTPSRNTLIHVFESIIFINTPLTTYDKTCDFYCYKNEALYKFPPAFQRAVEKAIFELQGIQFFLDRIDNFWCAEHEAYPITNKEYMASLMATQLQCANMVRAEDNSLNLESVDLLLRLAHLNITPKDYFYRLSLTQMEYAADIPLIGAFLITRKPENHTDDLNPCVLYIPGLKIQQFDSIALLKTYLATHLINPNAPHPPLRSCIALRQQGLLIDLTRRGVMDEQSICLTSFSIDPEFFSEHIQRLIDQHKQDVTYIWSQTDRPVVTTTDPHHFQPRYSLDYTAFLFFTDTVQNHAIPALERWKKSQLPVVTPKSKPTSLQPIKLHFILHQDLNGRLPVRASDLLFKFFFSSPTASTAKEAFFSWLATELENISGRKVELIEIEKEIAPELYTFNYMSKSHDDAIHRWKEAVTQFLKRTSQSTSPLDKFTLLTYHPVVASSILGVADRTGGQFAIASTVEYRITAHEIGHMLGAEHDAGEIIYDGWWSETTMRPFDEDSPYRTASHRFSDKNRALIKTYLSQFD